MTRKNFAHILFSFSLTLCLFISSAAFAYEQQQLSACILNAKNNAALKGFNEKSMENYCDCALNLIMDQGKDIQNSGYECAVKNFS